MDPSWNPGSISRVPAGCARACEPCPRDVAEDPSDRLASEPEANAVSEDPWLYWFATHGRHAYMNPVAAGTFRTLGRQLGLRSGIRVLDVGCGKGTLLLRWARDHGIQGTGIDASPHHSAEARAAAARLEEGPRPRFVHARAEEWSSSEPLFDVACCVGADWIWGGPQGTLGALKQRARPGGCVVFGSPFARRELPEAYCRAEGFAPGDISTLDALHDSALAMGLTPLFFRGSSERDWDRYEFLQLASLDVFTRENPARPELPAMRQRAIEERRRYLRWGRDALGFAVWAFRVA